MEILSFATGEPIERKPTPSSKYELTFEVFADGRVNFNMPNVGQTPQARQLVVAVLRCVTDMVLRMAQPEPPADPPAADPPADPAV